MDGYERSIDDSRHSSITDPGRGIADTGRVGRKISVQGIAVERLRPEHCRIVPHLRSVDIDEMRAMSGISPALCVAYSAATSRPGYAVLMDGEPIAVFGAGQRGDGTGVPWLVGTDEMERHPVAFYRASKGFIHEMSGMYGYLENWVDERNALSVRWLRWAGFTIEEPEPFGDGVFHRFWMDTR